MIKLRSSGVGCYIGNTFLGAFGYADDIILICPTVRALKVMLSIAQNYSNSFDIKFNISKSLLVAYNKVQHGMIKCAVNFNNVTIESRAQAKHIGNLVGFDTNLNAVVSGVLDFQRKLNVMMSKFKFISSDVLYVLFKTYCMPLFGSALWVSE